MQRSNFPLCFTVYDCVYDVYILMCIDDIQYVALKLDLIYLYPLNLFCSSSTCQSFKRNLKCGVM